MEFGVNDLVIDTFSPEEYRKKTISLIKKVINSGALPVLISSNPTLVGDNLPSVRKKWHVSNVINRIKKEIAKTYNVPYIDKHDEIKKIVVNSTYQWQEIQPDELHYNDIGHRIEASIIASYLYPNLIKDERQIHPEDVISGSEYSRSKLSQSEVNSITSSKVETINRFNFWIWSDNNDDCLIYHPKDDPPFSFQKYSYTYDKKEVIDAEKVKLSVGLNYVLYGVNRRQISAGEEIGYFSLASGKCND